MRSVRCAAFACASLAGVERARRQALRHDVGDDARADHGRAIASALAGSFRPVRIEAVAECSARVMGEEAVLALPADAVPGAERVDVDVPSVRVEGNALPRRGEAEDRLAGVRQSAGEVVEAAVGPAGRRFEHRQPARPPERNETSAWAFASTCRRTFVAFRPISSEPSAVAGRSTVAERHARVVAPNRAARRGIGISAGSRSRMQPSRS